MKKQIGQSTTSIQRKKLDEKYNAFKILTTDIFRDIKNEIASDSVLDKLFIKNQVLVSNDTTHHQEPETFTKEKLIDKLLEFLGYSISSVRHETGLKVLDGKQRDTDYKLLVRTNFILLEAEPINKDLEAPKTGASQVREWLNSRFSETEYGIATDGLKWKLLKVSQSTQSIPTIFEIDLAPFFVGQINQQLTDPDNELRTKFEKFYFNFSKETILTALIGGTLESLEKEKEVTVIFYRKYIKYIFGIDRGTKISNCLLNKITNSNSNSTEQDKRLFSVITMNRLIFTKFLQDKGIINKDFLNELIYEYKKSPNNPNTFYQTFLKPLFYEIFSRPPRNRKQVRGNIIFETIPYLNGGLFIETVPFERDFDIDNDILFEIIGTEFLAGFNLTYSSESESNKINPDILGRVFEKTINYITSKSESNKKEQGAYYTPTEITSYLCEKSVKQVLYLKSIELLQKSNYSKHELAQWQDYDYLLSKLPDDPEVLEKLHQIVSEIKILDPACGSGHFLKDVGDLLLGINRVFYSRTNKPFTSYAVQKKIIINNLYGVDIDVNAVEIAKLRLWMGLIDSADDKEKLEALPNIEYNIKRGNSLVGFLEIPNDEYTRMDEYLELNITKEIALLESNYPERADEIRELSRLPNLKNMTKIKEILIEIYKNENMPELRNILKILIDHILQSIESKTSERYIAYANHQIKKGGNRNNISQQEILYLKPFHWVIEFTDIINGGGFDVIIENPPYEVLKPKDREFFDNYHSDFRFLGSKQDQIKSHLLKEPRISAEYKKYINSFETYELLLKYLPEYSLQNNVLDGKKWKKSDPNYYRLFIERSNQLLKNEGMLGMICPKGFIGELGSTALRRFFLEEYSSFEFREFNNKTDEGLIFDDVDPNFRFVVFTYIKKKDESIIGYCFCSKLAEIDRPYATFEKNALKFYRGLTGDLCILQWIRSHIEFQILEKLLKFPSLKENNSTLKLTSARELDMSLDKDKFTDKPTAISLWEGSLINHYSKEKKPIKYVIPEKFNPKKDFYKERIVIRTILPNSVRKFYSTILPPKIAIGNSLVYFVPEQTHEQQCYVVGLLNSLLIEYRGKQLLSKMTLNQYVIDILPIPRETNSLVKSISKLSCDLIEEKIEKSKRGEIMNKIDALVFKLFGLDIAETKFVLETFKIEEADKSQIIEFFKSSL